MPESFFVTLEKTDGLDDRITINNSANIQEIEIIDNDSMYDKTVYIIYSFTRFFYLI